ncbi:hypothetical protein TgHK011_008675 [Trichoderma gracile]|nr:hypothetical protein TgHK011_008675 [Trichoderma gracile]
MAVTKLSPSIHITHIGTATAIIQIDNLTILTDPYFSPEGTEWVGRSGAKLVNSYQPPLGLEDLPPIDLILLSQEDHKDNLDDLGRQLLNGRHVFTTTDGAQNLAPRKGVRGMKPWETTSFQIGGSGPRYEITATPCQHLPGGECLGFVISAEHFGMTDGKPNAVYFSGDTIYIEELARIRKLYHVSVGLFSLGKATVPRPGGGTLQITMDGRQAVQLMRDINPDVVIPLHFEGWSLFKEGRDGIEEVVKEEGVEEKFKFLAPGLSTKIL